MQKSDRDFAISVFDVLNTELHGYTITLLPFAKISFNNLTLCVGNEKCELCLTEPAVINHLCIDCDHYIRTDAEELMWEWKEEEEENAIEEAKFHTALFLNPNLDFDDRYICPACQQEIEQHDDHVCDFMKNEMDKQAWKDEQMSLLLAECRGKS